jgi:hypothetical protein
MQKQSKGREISSVVLMACASFRAYTAGRSIINIVNFLIRLYATLVRESLYLYYSAIEGKIDSLILISWWFTLSKGNVIYIVVI